jgi:hypothetical protein
MIAAFSDGLVASLLVELTRYEREQDARAPHKDVGAPISSRSAVSRESRRTRR